MGADNGAVDDGPAVIELDLQGFEDRIPVPLPSPVGEAVVDRLPRPESFGQVTPGQAGLSPVQNGLDEQTVAPRRRGSCLLSRENSLELTPLSVGERVPVHPDL